MGIALSKNFEQKQNLKLTPSLKKSIDLLQLSRSDLVQKIESHINENPFLNKTDQNIENKNFKSENHDFASDESLKDHLLSQLNDLKISKNDLKLCNYIIDSIDETGMIYQSSSEIKKAVNCLSNESEIEFLITNIIHKFNPPGVGFRNYKECIKIQIDKRNISKKKKSLIYKILFNKELDDLNKIKKSLIKKGIDENDFNKAFDEIKKCDLSPGLNFQQIKYIQADLKLKFKNLVPEIKFNNENFPKIMIDENLIQNIKKEGRLNSNKKIKQEIDNARWLLRSVKSRNETVIKVGKYILERQSAFFSDNPLKMQTINNLQIANSIGMHPSTVSRIIRNKYIDTPKGLITLKSLLVSSVSKTRDISPAQLSKLIKDIIDSENIPKSDKKISIELNKRGFNLARRTISKYRKKINIPSSRYR